ncbi:MAG: prepilin-type N-terminal cleavage/methylation domain-containing protein [Patescibacteria group bacterium]|nr:prepilin-type N-terminal cleavage/methylation domain-containing protein [Patescibacteria group bacterium]
MKNNLQKGFSLIEVVIASAIISIVIFATMSVAQKSLQLSNRSLRQAQANFLLEEGVEVVKSTRDNGWSNISDLTLDTDYYFEYNSSWSLSLIPNTIDAFTRTVFFESVFRDVNDDLSSSGTLDDDARKVTITVSWGSVSRELSFYLLNIHE